MTVEFKDNPGEPWGMVSVATAVLRRDGDWLVLEGARVFNTATNTPAPRLRSIRYADLPRHGRTIWR